MSILIKGMEMPKGNDELRLIIHSNGQVIISHQTYYEEAEAVSISPHGRLIDADAFEYTCKISYCSGCEDYNGIKCKTCWVDDMLGELENAPTIIEAEVKT